jgi:hypothetical protein
MAQASGRARTVIVDAEDPKAANAKVHRLGLYRQGDEFYIVEIPPTELEYTLPRDRLVTDEELRAVGACTLGELDQAMKAMVEDLGTFTKPEDSN